jgi:hypothetical protein
MGTFRMSLDIVVPTVRANASSLRRVAELSVPPAFASLRILIVVDGPQSEVAWLDLRRLKAQHASIELLSTRPGPHGWPAGASAARNVGIEASAADWILFLDDDTTPSKGLLHRYAEAAEASLGGALAGTFSGDLDGDLGGGGARRVYGFAGATVFVAPPASPWAVAARCSGMCDAFTASCRAAHPPWSPTANLMLRRTAAPAHAGVAAAAAAGGVSAQDVATAAVAQAEAQGVAEAEAEAEEVEAEADTLSECCKLLPPPQPPLITAAPRSTPPPRSSKAEQPQPQPQQRRARLPWCHFDETLPANGGAEDVDICFRASVWRESAPHATVPLEMVSRSNGFDCDDNPNWSAPAATQRLVAVPLAVTTHRLWDARAMLARGLRWGYAGGLIAAKFPALARRRPLNGAESLVLAPPAAALLALLAAPLLRRPCRPWRAALLCAAAWFADAVFLRAIRLPRLIALAGYDLPHARVTLDEPALEACCGRSRCARWAGLAALHTGPLLWLSLCFEFGELWAKLAPCSAPSRLLLLGHMWDYSFGLEEPQPPKMIKQLIGNA